MIDEFDTPLLDSVNWPDYKRIQKTLANFYSVLKNRGEIIRFCFITGITRFSYWDIFDGLNNIRDITEDPRYAALCGYTDEELDYYFKPYLEKYFEDNAITSEEEKTLFRNNIRDYYLGYRFSPYSDVTVYNPIDIGYFFKRNGFFRDYWLLTGSLNVIRDIVKRYPSVFEDQRPFTTTSSAHFHLDLADIFSQKVSHRYVVCFLHQAGYLTIKEDVDGIYRLGYPNEEVGNAMVAYILALYGFEASFVKISIIKSSMKNGDIQRFMDLYKGFYKYRKRDLFFDEKMKYDSAFFSSLNAIFKGRTKAEDSSCIRIDIEGERVYIIELTLDESADVALSQIKEKRYADAYMNKGSIIHLLGINFSSESRNIEGWKEEILKV